jgi:molybdopterin-guanine dinucleotide biosynthesis protein B
MRAFGFAGWSGSGKTTLIERLIPLFGARGLEVGVIKHARHAVDVDRPGTDSYRHRRAGAREVLVSSPQRWALVHELRGAPEPTLEALLARLAGCDLALVEGYKRAPIPKLEVRRAANGEPLLFPGDPHIIAVASDSAIETRLPPRLPYFALDDAGGIAAFILTHLGMT